MRVSTIFLLILSVFWASSNSATVSRNQFHTILQVVEHTYQGVFLAKGKRLVINSLWNSEEKQASAWLQEDRRGIISILRIPGSIARTEHVNADAFALIVCHEIGHHLAGPPRVWKYSIEGQADYFGVSECL